MVTDNGVNAAQVALAKSVPIERIIEQRQVRLRGRIERVGPCPVCGGVDRFAINITKQVWNCRGCGKGGDVIDLVCHIERIGFAEAVAYLAGAQVAQKPSLARSPSANGECDAELKLALAGRIYGEAEPIADTPGAAYLQGRGIALEDVPVSCGLRWHPSCPWGGGTTPCIVARYTDATTGQPRGIRRRPIRGGTPWSLGPTAGCVIRLWPDADISTSLVIGEGVETVLAAATRIAHKGTLLRPAWACGSASNLENFPLLCGIEAITILVDHDDTNRGQQAAERCARRWLDAGREVIRLMPGALGADFNDLVRR